jgi:hypothetical protein
MLLPEMTNLFIGLHLAVTPGLVCGAIFLSVF